MNAKPKILLVDDDKGLLASLGRLLRLYYRVVTAASGEQALAILERSSVDLIVADWSMPEGIDGKRLLKTFNERYPNLPVLVITGRTEPRLAENVVPFACGFLRKPVQLDAFREAAEYCLRWRARTQFGYDTKGVLSFSREGFWIKRGEGERISLSRTEVRAFSLLWERPGETVTAREIARAIRDQEVLTPSASSQLSRRVLHGLRKKIEVDPDSPRFLQTVWGKGVRLVVQGAE